MQLLITCDRLFDGRGFRDGGAVLVEGDRIRAVGPDADALDVPEGAERLHAPFLMPGLIDSHVHLRGFPSGFQGPPVQPPFELVEHFLRLLVCNGVTSVRDAGNALETTRYCRRWGAAHDGPRVFATSPVLDVPPLLWPFSRITEEAGEARRAVDRLAAEGVEWISLFHNLPLEVAEAAADRAAERGLRVSADVRGVPAHRLAEAGVTSLEHAAQLLDPPVLDGDGSAVARMRAWSRVDLDGDDVARLVDRLVARGTFVCPTLLYTHRWCSLDDIINEPHLEYMTAVMPLAQHILQLRSTMGRMLGKGQLRRRLKIPSLSAAEQREVDDGLAALRGLVVRLHEAGVPLVAGTDAPSPSIVPGFSLHQELALMAESGLPPDAVLASATSAAARLLGREDELGHVRPGARADLVLVDGDPGRRIRETRNVQAVVRGGRRVDRAAHLAPVQEAVEALA